MVEKAIDSDEENDEDIDSIECNEYCILLLAYERCLSRVQVEGFDENIDYILDLIDVMMVKLEDHENFYATYLDINYLFGVIKLSVALVSEH